MVDPCFESRNISRDYIQLDWIESACSGCGAHIVKVATEPILSGESSREVEEFGTLCESKVQRFWLKRASRDRHQRFRVGLRKILWQRCWRKLLVKLELDWFVCPIK